MKNYIDAEKLKEKIYAEDTVCLAHGSLPEFDQGCHYALLTVLSFIESLQQEQPEVDLDFSMFAKEMDVVFNLPKEVTKNTEQNPLNWEYAIARHFYELGFKARKEE